MAETENAMFYNNFQFDLTSFRLDLYRLACYFLASPRIEQIMCETAKGNGDTEIIENPLVDVESQFFGEEVGRILLQTAVFCRLVLDEMEADPDELPVLECGHLQVQGVGSNLSLREACNKIIHSQRINYDNDPPLDPVYGFGPLNPVVYLYGSTQSGKSWKATLHVLEFVQKSIRVLRHRYLADFISESS